MMKLRAEARYRMEYQRLGDESSPPHPSAQDRPGCRDTDAEYIEDGEMPALASDPDWIFIITWNDRCETTHIEPLQASGELYLDIALEYAVRWKGD